MYRNIYTVSTVNAEDDLSFVINAKEGKVSLRAPTTDQKNEWMRKIHDFSQKTFRNSPLQKPYKICKILKNYFYSTPLNLKKIKSTRLFKDVYTELKIYGFQQNTKITFEIFSSPHLNNLFEHSRIFNLIHDTLNLRMWLHPSLHKWNRPVPKGYKPILFNIHNNVLMLYFLPVPKDQS